MKIVAFHYRLIGDPKGHSQQGHWKEFDSVKEGAAWLRYRCNKQPDSPKGIMLVDSLEGFKWLKNSIYEGKQPESLVLAFNSYLEWSKISIQ